MTNIFTNEDILSWVRSFVWSGEYSAEGVGLLIEDQLGLDAEVDEIWLRNAFGLSPRQPL